MIRLWLGIWEISKSGTACDNPTHASSLSPDDDDDDDDDVDDGDDDHHDHDILFHYNW